MKLEAFRYLLEVDRLHSISAAARSLHIRQTTLSAAVKSVEEELGYPIFQRTPSGVAATQPGEQFLALAWEIHIKYEELLRLKQRTTEGGPTVRLLLPPSVMSCLSLPLTKRFCQFELRGNLAFEECMSMEVCNRITAGHANLGLAYLTEENIRQYEAETARGTLCIQRLLWDRIELLVARTHPLAGLERVDMDQLYGERLATAKTVRDDAILGKRMLKWAKVTKFTDVDIMKQAILEQKMIGFLPRYTLLSEGNASEMSRFAVVPVEHTERENRLSLCLVQREERVLGYQEKILSSCIQDYFKQFCREHPEFGEEGVEHADGASAVPDRDQ